MATSNLTIVAKVIDAASDKLAKIGKGLENTGKSAKTASVNFTELNRVLFSTTAFIGFFTKGFTNLFTSMEKAAELDRVTDQYERVFGSQGNLISNIRHFTTTTVDRMNSMKAAIALGQLGIAKNSTQAADLIAMAATASKMAGKDTSEGVNKIVQSLKDGSLSGLEFLNTIRTGDPVLKAHLELLHKAGGALGGAITAQAKYNLILDILRRTTKGHLRDQRDLVDVIQDARQSFSFLGMAIGRFLGTALGPQIDKFVILTDKIVGFIDTLRKTDKTLITTIKNVVLLTASFSSLFLVIGTLRLVLLGLTKAGIGGFPLLISAVASLGLVFGDTEKTLDSITNKFKAFGAIITGTAQLVSSFLQDPENYAKGIGKMDKSLADFLRKQGLLELTQNIARFISIIGKFFKDVDKTIEAVKDRILSADNIITRSINSILHLGAKPWERSWIDSGNKVRDNLVATAGAIMAAWAGLKLGKAVLSKIPGVGKLFGLGAAPKGTRADPIYVAPAFSLGGLTSFLNPKSNGLVGKAAGIFKESSMFWKLAEKFPKFLEFAALLERLPKPIKFVGGRLFEIGTILIGVVSLFSVINDKTLDISQKFLKASTIVGDLIGTLLGGAAGAALGGVVGGPVGAVIGGILGAMGGGALGGKAFGGLMRTFQGAQNKQPTSIGGKLAAARAGQVTADLPTGATPYSPEFSNRLQREAQGLAGPITGLGHIKSAIVPEDVKMTDLSHQQEFLQDTIKLLNKESAGRMGTVMREAVADAVARHAPKLDPETLMQIIKAGVDGSKITHYTKPGAKHANVRSGGC